MYTHTVGHPVDDSGNIKIAFRRVGDFGTPRFSRPDQPNYCTVTTGDCRIEPRWDPKGNTRPWDKTLYLKITGGYLDSCDKVVVTFRDASKGCPAWQMQTFCEDTLEFKTYVEPFATYQLKELPQFPTMTFTAGKAMRRSHTGLTQTGAQTFEATDAKPRLKARSNPINVQAKALALLRWWSDFHGQSEETVGSNSIEDYFSYARDCAKLDIIGQQGNAFQVTDAFEFNLPLKKLGKGDNPVYVRVSQEDGHSHGAVQYSSLLASDH